MKQIEVSGAIIIRQNSINNKKEVLATQRGYGNYKGMWEIPGGKLEEGESPFQCIIREIKEELAADIAAERELSVVNYDYPEFSLKMHCIVCNLLYDNISLLEHDDAKWLNKDNIESVNWLPADLLVLDKIKELL